MKKKISDLYLSSVAFVILFLFVSVAGYVFTFADKDETKLDWILIPSLILLAFFFVFTLVNFWVFLKRNSKQKLGKAIRSLFFKSEIDYQDEIKVRDIKILLYAQLTAIIVFLVGFCTTYICVASIYSNSNEIGFHVTSGLLILFTIILTHQAIKVFFNKEAK